MGCDIYFFGEHRKDSDSGWEFLPGTYELGGGITEWDISRSYVLFGMLAGVRVPHPASMIDAPRGWPDDCCPELAEEGRHVLGHTYSWLYMSEMLDYFEGHQHLSLVQGFLERLGEMRAASGSGPGDIRALFYFDS